MNVRKHTANRGQSGFTLIEVMMALTVLAIGLLGIVALQTATISSTQDAQQFTVANSVLNTWIQRLQRDAQRWNHPSKYSTASDLASDTAWIGLVTTASDVWKRPGASGLEPNASPAFDRNGLDVPLSDVPGQLDRAVYCTHIRLRMIYPDTASSGGLIRAEVRVFWAKRRLGDGALFATYGMNAGICTTTGNETAIGSDQMNFHWAYALAQVQKAQAQ
ncbi:MAG: type IV pilus modification PilV family protein [Polyangiales bacterium]